MANKRPLSPAAPDYGDCDNGKKQTRVDIKPVILKRSEIYNFSAPVVVLEEQNQARHNNNSNGLQSCLRRGPSCSIRAPSYQQNDACSVQFRSSVAVKRIPSRYDYSEGTRRLLWNNLQEIRENAMRNEAEFLFDGGNWRHCCEEDDMYYDKHSGSMIHPAHVATVRVLSGNQWRPAILNDQNVRQYPKAQSLSYGSDKLGLLPPNPVCMVGEYPGDIV